MFGHRSQRDFEDEIKSHLALEAERLRAQGMSAEAAERAARRNFGNVGQAEDRFYHGRRLARLQDLGRDLRHAWRGLRRTPGFFVTCVLTLALAIGAETGMFSVVNAVILRPLPFEAPDRLVSVSGTAPGSDVPGTFDLSPEFYLQYRDQSRLLDGIFVFFSGTATLRTGDRTERIGMAWPTNDMYATLGVHPVAGRLPVAADGDDAAVISERLWTSWFGRDSTIIGKWYFVADSLKQIVGVMPADFQFPSGQTLVWVSGDIRPGGFAVGRFGQVGVARLKPGVSPDQAAEELTVLARELPARYGGSPGYARLIEKHRAVVAPLLETWLGPARTVSLWVLLGAVSVVLLIACANVANLFLVRAETRTRDLALRRAVGASRTQLVRLQLAEAFLVAVTAGVLAIGLSAVTLPLFVAAAPERIPRLSLAGIDLTTIAVTFGLVVFAALACGLVPAIRASSPDLARLRDGGRNSTGGRHWGRDLLVAGQTALALVLLIGSGLLIRSFVTLTGADPGYDVRDVYTFQFAPEQEGLRDGPSLGGLHLAVMERLRALPGVRAVGVVNNVPLDETTAGIRTRVEGQPPEADGAFVRRNFAGGDFFEVLGIRLLRGRTFTTDEAVRPNASTVVSRSAAELFWPGQDPIGRRIYPQVGGQDTLAFTVVGVVEDVKQTDWREIGDATIYFPLTGPTPASWAMGSPAYVVKSPRAGALRDDVRRVIRALAPEAPVYREFTMEYLAERSMVQLSFTMLTLGVLSGLALLLGAIGLFGVLSYLVAQRTREIGMRMALGATAANVRRMVVVQGAKVVLAGAILGLGAALLSTRLLGALLYGVRAVDPLVFLGMAAAMIGVGLLASYVPAYRASSVSPIESLRSD